MSYVVLIIYPLISSFFFFLKNAPPPEFSPFPQPAPFPFFFPPPGTASGAGAYTFTATATDRAGNTTSVVVHYSVDYVFAGPFLIPGRTVVAGTTLTVFFLLSNVNLSQVTNGAGVLLVDGVPASPSGTFNSGNAFRYSTALHAYEYRMSTSSLSTGVHLLTIVLDDGTRREESIAVNAAAPPPLTLSAATLRTGQSETVHGTGYAPGTLVTIRLNGIVVD